MSLPKPGLYTAKHPDREKPFLVSVMPDLTGALTGVIGYEMGQKRPSRQSHWLAKANVRQWLSELTLTPH